MSRFIRRSTNVIPRLCRFIVGTGRCGSTLLSRMLAKNAAVLDASEFLVGIDWSKRFQTESMSGEEFWRLLDAPHPLVSDLLKRGYLPPEVTYPFERPGARFSLGEPLPWILTSILGAATEDPDALYDELAVYCRRLTPAPPPAQAVAVLDWLVEMLGKAVWVERSGAAIVYLEGLRDQFPNARFLHLHRQGEATALSLREHPVFRLGAMLTYGLPMGEGGTTEDLERLGADADHVDQLLASRPSPHHFGRWWSHQLLTGLQALHAIAPDHYREATFEDLLADPEPLLAEAAQFLEIPDPRGAWRAEAAQLVHGAPEDRFATLSRKEQEDLVWACLPGNRLLGRRPAITTTDR